MCVSPLDAKVLLVGRNSAILEENENPIGDILDERKSVSASAELPRSEESDGSEGGENQGEIGVDSEENIDFDEDIREDVVEDEEIESIEQ